MSRRYLAHCFTDGLNNVERTGTCRLVHISTADTDVFDRHEAVCAGDSIWLCMLAQL
jgi:hypothetical protein